ncbi:MAG: nucleotidyltransferase domain-containing protein [Planctomycetaceae bacterium]|jgi:predicted nucleotidyltransferase|nr:nucleotidyltransferase domain-containing protein [Planctomycetaceae bacterium]
MNQDIESQIAAIRDIIVATVPVERIYLFGSYACGTPNADSDLDFYVVMKEETPYHEFEAESRINDAVLGHKSIPTDVLVTRKSTFDYRCSATTLEREVSRKGVLIYG